MPRKIFNNKPISRHNRPDFKMQALDFAMGQAILSAAQTLAMAAQQNLRLLMITVAMMIATRRQTPASKIRPRSPPPPPARAQLSDLCSFWPLRQAISLIVDICDVQDTVKRASLIEFDTPAKHALIKPLPMILIKRRWFISPYRFVPPHYFCAPSDSALSYVTILTNCRSAVMIRFSPFIRRAAIIPEHSCLLFLSSASRCK